MAGCNGAPHWQTWKLLILKPTWLRRRGATAPSLLAARVAHPQAARSDRRYIHRERAPGLHLAGDVGIIERALGLQSDQSGLGVALVAVLKRRLHGVQRSSVHWGSVLRRFGYCIRLLHSAFSFGFFMRLTHIAIQCRSVILRACEG